MAMRPLTLHTSALNDSEYFLYTSCLRDLSEDEDTNAQRGDDFYQNFKVGVREARAWLRGRYSSLSPTLVDTILRFFCPNLASTEVLTGGQFFAVLRLVHHVLSGKDVDKNLVFVQAHPETQTSISQASVPPPSRPLEARQQTADPISDPPSPDVNPFFSQVATSEANAPPAVSGPSHQNVPPAVPPKPSTNPFLMRRGSEAGYRPPTPADRAVNPTMNARTRSAAAVEGRIPPLPPRKPVVPLVPPPRHSSQTHSALLTASSSTNPNILIQQSLQATRVAQSLKKAEQRLEQERVLEVLKSSSGGHRTRSSSPIHDGRPPPKPPSSSSSHETDDSGRLPVLPPRRKLSPPSSTISGSTSRSLEQVARASVPFKSSSSFRSTPSAVAMDSRSPTVTPPRSLTDLPPDPPPTHPDRKPTLAGLDAERSIPPSPDSPRVFRSKSMHHPSAPPVPPSRKRPESVQLAPTSSPPDSPFASPAHAQFPSSLSQPPLSRHHSVSSSFSGRSHRSDNSALSEPIANLQKTLTNLHQRAQPHFDSARYKAEAAFNPRGFVQHAQPGTRWMRQAGEERLMDDDDDAGEGRDDAESLDQDVEESSAESELNERLRRLKMGDASDGGGGQGTDADFQRMRMARDDLKWPVGEGWKRL